MILLMMVGMHLPPLRLLIVLVPAELFVLSVIVPAELGVLIVHRGRRGG